MQVGDGLVFAKDERKMEVLNLVVGDNFEYGSCEPDHSFTMYSHTF